MTLRRRPLADCDQHGERVPGGMADTESTDLGAAAESDLQRAESDLHPADPVDDMRTAEYGRESERARADTSGDTPTPTEVPGD
jgi:hypothetical protein